jgi:hypothetical protein
MAKTPKNDSKKTENLRKNGKTPSVEANQKKSTLLKHEQK